MTAMLSPKKTLRGRTALPISNDTTLSCVDECTEWDIRDQFETINGMPVYYGGDLCDSDDSDCEVFSSMDCDP